MSHEKNTHLEKKYTPRFKESLGATMPMRAATPTQAGVGSSDFVLWAIIVTGALAIAGYYLVSRTVSDLETVAVPAGVTAPISLPANGTTNRLIPLAVSITGTSNPAIPVGVVSKNLITAPSQPHTLQRGKVLDEIQPAGSVLAAQRGAGDLQGGVAASQLQGASNGVASF